MAEPPANASPNKIPWMDLSAQNRALKAQLLEGFASVLDRSAFCLGPEVEAFEREWGAFCGSPHAVGFNSGTSALHAILLALGVKPGDEVVTTPYTFVATAWAISYCGATPVFADIEPRTFLLDPQAAERAITPRTKAIVPVHLYGQPAEIDELRALADKKGLPLVEDACQAHGAEYRGRRVGCFGEAAAFSFYPSKNLGACGEGGAALTGSAALAARLRALRDHGSVKRYYHDEIGFNYRMEGMQAMVLRVKLPHLARWNTRRQELAAQYHRLLENCAVQRPALGSGRTHVYHLYVVRHARREALAQFLTAREIGCGMHYPVPVHLQKAYAHLGHGTGSFPQAERAAAECLSLPLYPELSDEQVERVARAVGEF